MMETIEENVDAVRERERERERELHSNKIKRERGITLVALVVTVIILLILAGITIAQLTGSGLFENAKLAEQKSKEAQEKEKEILEDYANKINGYVDGTRDDEISEIITNPQLILIRKTSSTIRLRVITENAQDENIAAYVIFNGNNEIERVSEVNEILIENLTQNTEYKYYAKILDKYGRFSTSTETLTVTTENMMYLYNAGSETQTIVAATGGYQGTLTKNTDHLFGTVTDSKTNATYIPWWHFENKLDVTNMEKIYFEFYDVTMNNDSTSIFVNAFLNVDSTDTFSHPTDCYAVDSYTGTCSNISKVLCLDVSNLTGEYYIGFGGITVPDYQGYGYNNPYTGNIEYKIKSIYY